jgi:hypothetical protein
MSKSIAYLPALAAFSLSDDLRLSTSITASSLTLLASLYVPSITANTKIYSPAITGTSISAGTYYGKLVTKGITVPDVRSNENITMFYLDRQATFTNAYTVLSGITPFVTWALNSGGTRSSAGVVITGTTSSGTTSSGTGITHIISPNVVVNSGSWIWLTTSATGGTTNEFHLTVQYRET